MVSTLDKGCSHLKGKIILQDVMTTTNIFTGQAPPLDWVATSILPAKREAGSNVFVGKGVP